MAKKKKEIVKTPILETYNLFILPLGGIYFLIEPNSYYFPIFLKSKCFLDSGDKEIILEDFKKIEGYKQLIELKG